MENIRLSYDMIDNINKFVEETINIPTVTGICIAAYSQNSAYDICIYTILDHGLDYEKNLEDNNILKTDTDDYNDYFTIRRKYLDSMEKNVDLCLFVYDGFSSHKDITREDIRRDLLSSTILFDRFGNLNKIKEELFTMFKPLGNYSEIENITDVVTNNSSTKKLCMRKK